MPVFTIIQHEPVFFPIWYAHYSKHFRPSEIHVLHHRLPPPKSESQDRRKSSWESYLSVHHAEYGYNIVDVVNDLSFDHEWLRATVGAEQRRLLELNPWVLFAEVDEIVAPHPRTGLSLKEFAERSLATKNVVVCDGYEVVHDVDKEPPIFLWMPLLRQRRNWYWSKFYSKPLLSKVPLTWCNGFHDCVEYPLSYHRRDPDLLLFHLHKLDFETCLERNRANADREWADGTFGYQNRLLEPKRLRQWWTLNVDQKTSPADLLPIPEELLDII